MTTCMIYRRMEKAEQVQHAALGTAKELDFLRERVRQLESEKKNREQLGYDQKSSKSRTIGWGSRRSPQRGGGGPQHSRNSSRNAMKRDRVHDKKHRGNSRGRRGDSHSRGRRDSRGRGDSHSRGRDDSHSRGRGGETLPENRNNNNTRISGRKPVGRTGNGGVNMEQVRAEAQQMGFQLSKIDDAINKLVRSGKPVDTKSVLAILLP
eukprot:1367773-Amorphochlora_amoeboformis.AAC.1